MRGVIYLVSLPPAELLKHSLWTGIAEFDSRLQFMFRIRIKTNLIPCIPNFKYTNVGSKGVFISCICYPDALRKNYHRVTGTT